MFNRAQYMNNEVSHEDYYAQFATPAVCSFVRRMIGEDTIKRSNDPEFFSDIELRRWDTLDHGIRQIIGASLADSNASTSGGVRSISLSDTVCVAKAAARIIHTQ